MIQMLIVAACYATFYAKLGAAMQVLALALLAGAASYAVIMQRVEAKPLTSAELVMYVSGAVSIAVGLFKDDGDVVSSVAFVMALITISLICRAVPLDRLLDAGASIVLLCIVTCILLERGAIVHALSLSVGRDGLMRLMPLGIHPDMTGYIYGSGSLLLLRRMFLATRRVERLLMASAVLVCWLFVLAASARSSIIALIVAAAFAVVFEFRGSRYVSVKAISIYVACFAVVSMVFAQKLGPYIAGILELNSSARGVASGGSGRTDLWMRGISAVFDDPFTFAFGGGFRSSAPDQIGFFTENSYITILLDSGLFVGSAMILAFLLAPVNALGLSPPRNRYTSQCIMAATFMVFVTVESVFNRYLLAIGNPTSLFSLILLISLSLQRSTIASAVKLPQDLAVPVGDFRKSR